MANSVDPDQTTRSAASDLGLHCLFRSVCPNTSGNNSKNFIIILYCSLMGERPQRRGSASHYKCAMYFRKILKNESDNQTVFAIFSTTIYAPIPVLCTVFTLNI